MEMMLEESANEAAASQQQQQQHDNEHQSDMEIADLWSSRTSLTSSAVIHRRFVLPNASIGQLQRLTQLGWRLPLAYRRLPWIHARYELAKSILCHIEAAYCVLFDRTGHRMITVRCYRTTRCQ